MIRISDERVWLPLQENVAIFSKKKKIIICKDFRLNFRKIMYLHKNACSFIINSRITIRMSDERA